MDRSGQVRRGDTIRTEAHYSCLNPICCIEWKEKASNVECPKCGHKYVKWENYK